jgi:hypothetical protein
VPWLSAWGGLGNGTLATHCYKMPVNQSFTRDAGAEIWGFPKTVERIDFDYATPGRFGALLEMGGEKVFEIDLPRGGKLNRSPLGMSAYTYINGIAHVTHFRQIMNGMGIKFGGRDARLDLGSHPVANDLRSLGLPKKPLMTLWTEKLILSFGPAEKLDDLR